MTICIIGHFERPRVKKFLKRTIAALKKLNADFEACNIKTKKFNSKKYCCAIVIGGDGSLLRVVRELKKPLPVIGIACGERGFLMEIKQKQLEKKLKKIAECRCRTEKRLRIQATADGKKLPLALNEVLLVNKKSGGIIKYRIKINGRRVSENASDGVIVSTPTGSSGHALSAGGKRIKGNKLEIVQFNVMGKKAKPIIAGANSRIEIECFDKYTEYEVVIDGRIRQRVGKKLIVKKGKTAIFLGLR